MCRLDQLRHIFNREIERVADLDCSASRHKSRLPPIADSRMTDSQNGSQPSHSAGQLNQGIDVHGSIVGHSDMTCQPENVRQTDAGDVFLLHVRRMTDIPTPQTPGARLRALRKKQTGLTQDDVAAAVGVGRTHITMIENGGDLPGRETLVALADFFGVSVDYILHGGELSPQSPQPPKLVDDPDELALLAFWGDLGPDERRLFLKLLRGQSPAD